MILCFVCVAVCSGSGSDAGGERCGALGEPHCRGMLSLPIPTLVLLLWSEVCTLFSSFPLLSVDAQAAATREVFDAARNGKVDDVKNCIANGADVDGYKDWVRDSFLNV